MPHFAWGVALLTSMACTAAGLAPAQGAPPNIVLLLTDDLGINDLGCYGRQEHRTPHLDHLAQEGVRFTSAYCAQPICSASRAALLTGRAPARIGLTTYLPGRGNASAQRLLQADCLQALPETETTLGELFQAAGYGTAYVGKWHLGSGPSAPERQGFESVSHIDGALSRNDSKGERELTDAALDFLNRPHEAPFLLVVSHHTPHIPLVASPEESAKYSGCFHPAYAAMIGRLDDAVGEVLASLDRQGLADNTIVVFLSDNGGLHVPEGGFAPPTHNSPYRAGKGFLYEGGLRIPLIVRWPYRLPAGRTINEPIVNMDLLPTLCDWARIPVPSGLDGRSLAPLLAGNPPADERTLYWHFPHYTNQGSRPAGAVRRGDWKLIEHYEDGRLELYDLDRDPSEARDRHTEEPALASELQADLARWRRDVGARENATNPEFNEALHRLIYVDTDVSRLRPAATAAEMQEPLTAWRSAIDAAVRPEPKR